MVYLILVSLFSSSETEIADRTGRAANRSGCAGAEERFAPDVPEFARQRNHLVHRISVFAVDSYEYETKKMLFYIKLIDFNQ